MAAIYPAKPEDWVVDAQGLTKTFGTEIAVNDLTLQIPTGKIIGLIGPSGCGKTTTIRLLTGIYAPTSGQVTVLGVHPKDFTAKIRARLGYMPQLFVLYPDLTVWENMNFAASLYGLSFWRRGKRIRQLLDFVELGNDRHKLARSISGGMQRRLALAATLIHNPDLIFLDEPTAGIDPILRRKFWDQFQELKKSNRSLLITTQYVNEAAYCDFVGVMAEGRLLMLETPEGMRRRAFGGDVIDLSPANPLHWEIVEQLQQLPFIRRRPTFLQDNSLRLVVDDAGTAMPDLMEWLNQKNIKVSSIEPFLPPFDDVFVSIVEAANKQREQNQTASGLTGEEK